MGWGLTNLLSCRQSIFIKMVFSVPVQSYACSVKRSGDKTHPCGTTVKMAPYPDDAPLNLTDCFLWHKEFIIQMTNFGLIFSLICFLAK